MDHDHSHNEHSFAPTNINTAFIFGISLNLLFVVIEVIAGLIINSLSLLSDAGHNLADVGALALSLLAFRISRVKPNEEYTYGYRRASILVALFNAIVLLISIGAITYEAIHRFFNPEFISGKTISLIAGIGIIINAITALMFLWLKNKDLNIKSAYVHLMSDAAVSLGIVLGGIIIALTHWFWIDSVLGIVIAVVILFSTWDLLKASMRLSLDGVPEDIHLDQLKKIAMNVTGIKDFHHIHVWAISTTENALTAHLVLNENISIEQEQLIKHELKRELEQHNIQHITLETERDKEDCESEEC
jgi:cobalt-zinc-cadmium efflux system protein